MRLCHQQILIADPRDAAAAGCASMNGDELADMIPLADLDRRRLAAVLQVLRGEADRNERIDSCVFTDRCLAIDDDVRIEPHAVGNGNVVADRSKTDLHNSPRRGLAPLLTIAEG